MKPLKRIFDFYLNSSIHVALAVVSLTLITHFKFGIPLEGNQLAFIFFASITGYNFVKYAGIAKLNYLKLTKNLRAIQIFSLICFVLLLYFSWFQSLEFLMWVGFLGGLTFFYAVPIFPKQKNLRNIHGLKIIMIAGVWAGVTVGLPVLEKNVGELATLLTLGQVFFYVVAITIPFEIRDVKNDNVQLGTLPQRLGIFKSKVLACFLLAIIAGLELLQEPNDTFLTKLAIILVITTGMIFYTTPKRNYYYTAFWVESLPIMWLGLVLVF